MQMFGFLTPVGADQGGPLVNVTAADRFWHMLPRSDAVAAQNALSDALADLGERGSPTIDRLRAVLALDQRARKLYAALLPGHYGDGGQSAQPSRLASAPDKKSLRAAYQLSQSFGETYVHVLRQIRGASPYGGWREYAPVVLLRLFRHRQKELLLRPFAIGQSVPVCWTLLHDAYRYAETQGLARQPAATSRRNGDDAQTTLEHEYIHILLLEVMNGGELSPQDAFVGDRWIRRLSAVVSLEAVRAEVSDTIAENRFVVDLDSTEGLVRTSGAAAGTFRYLDPTPMLAQIGDAIATMSAAGPADGAASVGHGRQLKLLRKLGIIYSPKPAHIHRRGERKPVALPVQAVHGLAQIARVLRQEQQRAAVAAAEEVVPEVEEITITVYGGYTESPHGPLHGAEVNTGPGLPKDIGVATEVWQVKDRSESGCRLHGQVLDAKGVLPGALIAFRENEHSRWVLVVVRRLKRLVGNHVEIGVEYFGRDPRRVVMTDSERRDAPAGAALPKKGNAFVALFLPESAGNPRLPIKTLVLPACEFWSGRCLTLQSANANYSIRLKDALDEQTDFVWLSYDIVGQQMLEQAA